MAAMVDDMEENMVADIDMGKKGKKMRLNFVELNLTSTCAFSKLCE